ncbi:hypothetical protein KAU92_03340, partial [Candidatus Bathyarchaeota archaeon]|nr:hypothetical protein [Candidatus Bathyarchaeota archaeon]
MTEESASPTTEEVTPKIIVDATPPKESKEAAEFLKDIQEKAGQISESEMEEDNLVNEFFNSLLKILKPFSKTIEIPVSSLP